MNGHSAIDIQAHNFPEAYLELIDTQGSRFDSECEFSDPSGPKISVGGTTIPPIAYMLTDIDELSDRFGRHRPGRARQRLMFRHGL